MNNPDLFKQDNYVTVSKMIPTDLCKIVTKYALLQEDSSFAPELGPEAQVLNAHSKYADTLMETLLFFLRGHMEKNTGLELVPTYSYYRVYRPGMILDRHKDRPSCEISTTICFGYEYNVDIPNYSWGMYVDKMSINTPLGPTGEFFTSNNPGKLVTQNAGDAIIYRGCDIEHWRDPFNVGPNSYQVQGFFHYIDKNGPYYPEYAYDKRSGLGKQHVNVKGINN
jgi:hypothetical protein